MITEIVLGFLLIALGYCYLARPDVVSRINTLIKNTVLNDSYIALERRKIGVFLLLAGVFFLLAAFAR
ncbi:MAG: hypothetical protein WC421_06780 [Elusimicrobiales bacterium]